MSKKFVTAKVKSRSDNHVYIEARLEDGTVAYTQLVPTKDFTEKRFVGRFEWGQKGALDA